MVQFIYVVKSMDYRKSAPVATLARRTGEGQKGGPFSEEGYQAGVTAGTVQRFSVFWRTGLRFRKPL